MRRAVGAAAAVLIGVLAGACGDAGGADIGVGHGTITVTDAWIRPTPPISNVGAFYLRIANRGPAAERVVGVSSPRCAEIEIHRTETVDGVASMVRAEPDQLEIGPGAELRFEPSGLHIMCLGLDQPVEEGARTALTIEFETTGPLTVEAEAKNR